MAAALSLGMLQKEHLGVSCEVDTTMVAKRVQLSPGASTGSCTVAVVDAATDATWE